MPRTDDKTHPRTAFGRPAGRSRRTAGGIRPRCSTPSCGGSCRRTPRMPRNVWPMCLSPAWRHADELAAQNRPLYGWLALTARNKAISRWRSLKRRPSEPLDEDIASDFMLTPRASDGEDCIAELVAALPEPDHEILSAALLSDGIQPRHCPGAAHERARRQRAPVRGRAKLKQQYLARMGRPPPQEGGRTDMKRTPQKTSPASSIPCPPRRPR